MDRILQFCDAGAGAVLDVLPGDLREKTLDEVHPRGASRRQVKLEAGLLGQPGLFLVVLVRRGVVEHDVHLDVLLDDPIDTPRACDELAAMARLTVAA